MIRFAFVQTLLLLMWGSASAQIDTPRRLLGLLQCIAENKSDCRCNPELGSQVLARCGSDSKEVLQARFEGEAITCANFHNGDFYSCPMLLARNCEHEKLRAVLNVPKIGFDFSTRYRSVPGRVDHGATALRLAEIGELHEGKDRVACGKVRDLLKLNGTPER